MAEATAADTTTTDVVVVRTGVDYGIDDWPVVLADVVDRVDAAAG